MRLELKTIGSDSTMPAGRSKWFFERGRRTLGRSPDCDWQLPEDQRSVSKLHCTIERDARGFLLRDQSANGSRVDGIVVHEGETVRLADQARLELGGLAFTVHISGEAHQDVEDPDTSYAMSDEPLTISAILADIAPGGRTATGVLGSQSEDWLEPIARKEGPSPSRNVDIGWNGPPEIRASGAILPDDWNLDDNDNGSHSDYSTHLEHGPATRTAVPVSRARPVEAGTVETGTVETLQTINDNAPPPKIEASHATPPPGIQPARLGRRLDPLLHRLEDTLDASFAAFGLDLPAQEAGPSFSGRDDDEALVIRIDAVATRQAKLQAALESLLHHAEQMMEPRIIESRTDATAGPLGQLSFMRGRDYWHAYKTQFEKDGRTLSVRDVFRDAMMRTDGTDPMPALQAEEKEDRDDEK